MRPVGASAVRPDGFLTYLELPKLARVAEASVYLQVAQLVGDGRRTILRFENYGTGMAHCKVAVRLDADFADLEEAEGGHRMQTAEVEATWDAGPRELSLRYCHPRLDRRTRVRVEHSAFDVTYADGSLRFAVALPTHEPREIELVLEPIYQTRVVTAPARRSFDDVASPLERLRRDLRDAMPVLRTTAVSVARAWQTAVADLASLPYGLDGAPATPIAGLPIYLEFFGRDSLTIGWQALMATPALVRDALLANAAWQGRVIDDWRDEEPGKMIHRAGGGPLSDLGHDPFDRYYGDWATPPDFLIMLGQYFAWTAHLATVRRLLPAARGAIEWLERYGDLDRDGFLEYHTRSPRGDKNQGWKDTDGAIVDERGNIPENPIATSELQAYWYAGLQQAAVVFGAAGDVGYAAELLSAARRLKRRFNDAFWIDDEGFYAIGLGRDKRQLRSISSNTGHLLAAGVVPRDRARQVVDRLMQPDLFSGWGIRTLSSHHPSYNPFSYHLGSVWPVEQGTIALGLARYGFWAELDRLAAAVFDSTDLFVSNRLPEVIGGLPRDPDHPHPGIYPNSCEPQGWSASMIVLLIQSLLGMVPLAPLGLLVVDPHLPPWLPDLSIEGIRVGGSMLDLEFRRTKGSRTTFRVIRRSGRVRVIRQPPPQSPEATLAGRAGAALGSILRS